MKKTINNLTNQRATAIYSLLLIGILPAFSLFGWLGLPVLAVAVGIAHGMTSGK